MDLTSRVIIDDTCSIKTGILKIISDVRPFCFTSSFTYTKEPMARHEGQETSPQGKAQAQIPRSGRIHICAQHHFAEITKGPKRSMAVRRRRRPSRARDH